MLTSIVGPSYYVVNVQRSNSLYFFFSSRRRHTRFDCDWSSDVCSSDLLINDRTRVSNRLTALLKGYFPQVLGWFEDIRTQLVCDFLERWPQLSCLQQAQIGRASCRERV